MKCQYAYQVRARCPITPADTDLYHFTIESEHLIEVEKIIDFFDRNAGTNSVFQEALTQQCAVALGARVTSLGWHSGVRVLCVAP